jgi:alpha-L-fucosidase 2
MIFDARVQAIDHHTHTSCTAAGSLLIPSHGKTNAITLAFAAGTNYDPKKGNAAHNYSFKGVDPEATTVSTIRAVRNKSYAKIYKAHVQDHSDLYSKFTLDLPDPNNSANVPTAKLITEYAYQAGDPFVESLLFDYGRYLFIASSRPGSSLPPNLQGIWAENLNPTWSSDYHVNLNVQM